MEVVQIVWESNYAEPRFIVRLHWAGVEAIKPKCQLSYNSSSLDYLLIGPLFFYRDLLFVLFGDGPFMFGTAVEILEIERLGFAQLATHGALPTKKLYFLSLLYVDFVS